MSAAPAQVQDSRCDNRAGPFGIPGPIYRADFGPWPSGPPRARRHHLIRERAYSRLYPQHCVSSHLSPAARWLRPPSQVEVGQSLVTEKRSSRGIPNLAESNYPSGTPGSTSSAEARAIGGQTPSHGRHRQVLGRPVRDRHNSPYSGPLIPPCNRSNSEFAPAPMPWVTRPQAHAERDPDHDCAGCHAIQVSARPSGSIRWLPPHWPDRGLSRHRPGLCGPSGWPRSVRRIRTVPRPKPSTPAARPAVPPG